MDYTISNNAALFDEVLKVLYKYQNHPGVGEACEEFKAAKLNYVQRSTDHMMNCLVRGIHDLIMNPPSPALLRELKSVIHGFHEVTMQAGSRLGELARQYEDSGGKPLSLDEILHEVDESRGTSR